MAKIRVGSGFGKTSLQAALQRSRPGDILVLDPGRYDIGHLALLGLALHGDATPDRVHVTGAVTARAHCTFTNLTFQAQPYKNAIAVASAADRATLTNCVVLGEPGAKFPALWCTDGTMVLNGVTAVSDPEQTAIGVAGDATFHAESSDLGWCIVEGSTANLVDCTSRFLGIQSGSTVSTYGTHRFAPLPGKRVFTASGQSVGNFAHLLLAAEAEEAFADDSLIQITSVDQAFGGSFSILTTNKARVRTDDAGVRVIDQDQQTADAEHAQARPKAVHWPIEHAHEFSTVVAPQLNPGDTVVLDAGEYSLRDDEALTLHANLRGAGFDQTSIVGSFRVPAARTVTIRDVSLCAPSPEHVVLTCDASDATVGLERVAVCAAPETQSLALSAAAGRVVMHNCLIEASEEATSQGQVLVSGNARFEATNSAMGWLFASEGSEVTLSDCRAFAVNATGGASISVPDVLRIDDSTCDQYGVYVTTGARITIDTLAHSAGDTSVYLNDGTLTLTHHAPDTPGPLVVQRESGEVRGIDPRAYTLYELDAESAWELVHEGNPDGVGLEPEQEPAHAQAQTEFDAAGTAGPEADEQGPAGRQAGKGAARATDATASDNPLHELHRLVGLSRVKQQVQSFVNTVALAQKRAEMGLPTDNAFTLHSMFLGNPGTGKTTVARLIGAAMHQAGVVENDSFIEAGRAQLVSDNIGGTAKQTRALLESGQGGVIFIDEAYSLASEDSAGFASEAVTEILTFMENHRSDTMVILAGYNDKMHDLLAVNDGLKSRIKHRFDFEDYSPAEIADIGLDELARGQYTVNESLYRTVIAAAYARSADRSNARWVRNFNQDLRTVQGERVIAGGELTKEAITTILDADLHAVGGGDPEDRKAKLDEKLAALDGMVGLEPVKAWVRALVEQATVNQRMIEFDGATERPNYHVAFTGNPGTGKTTVAKFVAEIFHLLGVLTTPTVQSFAATQLIGRYLGHSADQTHKAFDAAMGGVLFIDEAHQLRPHGDSNSAMQQEVVDAMITRLEDDRDRFVAIFAGYTEQMHEFFDSDPGLRSRIPAEIEFPDYTPTEVGEIAATMLAQQWTFNEELCRDIAARAYAALPPAEQSNGRWVRTFTEHVVRHHNRAIVEHDLHGPALKQISDEVLQAFAPQ